ncbi:sulfurtransferase complex subunit TusB [Microbulbifer elongatus]|uniref:Sulfurtransferase complex subunit TusB n=1 Tax=Microbulbifer elongatus TaxID=86173 RepID=A0ABT1P4D5_9GAMM|nr:sulfurtransferase complex subunit TusB [Microbulbifer elongatus]MCQ3830950.1 sulfurtransferase complex subunit TusB [Microbulbifer elongatus]
MTLHIVNQSPHRDSALRDCLNAFAEDDALVLIEDGVYAAQTGAPNPLPSSNVFVLLADAEARGITIATGVEAIDEQQWVTLCVQHTPIVSWFR